MKKLIAVLLALMLCAGIASAEDAAILGKPFPDFTATDTEGNTFTLSGALEDHEAVLINLWATWCPPCAMEFPFLNEAFEKYGDRVAFISLSVEPNDTMEKIEDYRQSHGLSIPMGRDEDQALYDYINRGGSIPGTVIVDRFGNAAFFHNMCFASYRQISAVIEAFLGDDYVETVVLDGIPLPDATAAFPVAPAREVYVENEGARELFFTNDVPSNRLKAWVVGDDVAHLRMALSASDDPYDVILYNRNAARLNELSTLLNESGDGYVSDVPMPGEEDGFHIVNVALLNYANNDVSDAVDCYLIRSEDYLDELKDYLGQAGWELSDAGVEGAAGQDAPQAYVLNVVDQHGDPVPGVMASFCTDTTCVMQQSDERGIITFDGEPGDYHVQLLKVPEGYSFDGKFELRTGSEYGQWRLIVRKD